VETVRETVCIPVPGCPGRAIGKCQTPTVRVLRTRGVVTFSCGLFSLVRISICSNLSPFSRDQVSA